jgi:long-chain fatty acid transport protein
MYKMKHLFNYLYFFVALTGMGFVSSDANSGAFSLYTEGSASAVGNFAAGVAAEARDASIGWYNPAGLALIRNNQVVLGATGVAPTATLSGTSSFYQRDISDEQFIAPYVQNFKNLSGGRSAVVPNIHIAIPVGEKVTYGLSIVSPMGLSTSWPEKSALRYAGTLSELRMVDVSPEVGGMMTPNLSIGWGLDIQWADVSFNNVLGAPAAFQLIGADPTTWDSSLVNHGTSSAFGFHAGFLLMSDNKSSRFGFNYQYGVWHEFNGYSQLTGLLANINEPNQTITPEYKSLFLSSNPIHFPNILTFSVYQQVSPRVAMLGSIVYTTWSSFKTIGLNNVAAYNAREDILAMVNATTLQNYQNTIRAAFGMNFDINDKWQFRWGGGYDQSPTNNIDRDVRLPDVDKMAIAVGLQWKVTPNWYLDAGYSYLMPLSDVAINKTQVFDNDNYVHVQADGHAYAQLLGVQIAWRQ